MLCLVPPPFHQALVASLAVVLSGPRLPHARDAAGDASSRVAGRFRPVARLP